MAEHWIEASQARTIAADTFALCARLHAGLIDARARLFVVDGKKGENVSIPAPFWWAEGHEALEQNWTTGDFSTWFNRKSHLQAFGVTFSLSGIIAMVPIERRAIAARNLSVVASPDWVSPKNALKIVCENHGISPHAAMRYLVQQAQLGFISARAVLAQGSSNRHLTQAGGSEHPIERTWKEREWDVDPASWSMIANERSPRPDWELGNFLGQDRSAWIKLTGVHFLKVSLVEPTENVGEGSAVPAASKKAGGRPPAAFWDEMWCAIWGRIYRGELTPKRQSEIEDAMLAWLSDRGHGPSTSTVRPRARQLFAEMQKDGENSDTA